MNKKLIEKIAPQLTELMIKKIDTRHFKNLKKQITIYVTKDSYAEKWAKKHHFSYRYGTTGKE